MASSSQEVGAKKKLKVGLAGFGTVGRSVAKILCLEADGPFQLTHIYNRNIAKKKTAALPSHIHWTENIDDVLSSDIDIFVELIGGLAPAEEWVRKALSAGKSVVTANKLLIAEHGNELIELAQKAGKRIEFGASVAGGIPAIMGIQDGLAGDRLHKIAGILNGTCNFILTKMESTGASFADALKEAQQLGFAEADPSNDVDGIDARAKLVILTQAGLRVRVRSEQVPCRPISSVEAIDFLYAKELACAIRQVSMAQVDRSQGTRLSAAVQPALIPLSSLMAHVQGSQNLVAAAGEFAGQMTFSGYGAGGDPTAVAVVSDLYAIARTGGAPLASAAPLVQAPDAVTGDFTVSYYLRFVIKNRPGIIAELATVLSKHNIGVDTVLQKPGYPATALPFVMTLEPCSSEVLSKALEEIARQDFHVQPPVCMPMFLS